VRWGLVPSWAKDPKIGNRMINARMESVAEKPAFRRAFAKRRCLLPADGYFEWYGETKGKKQPFFIRPDDGGILAMAGLYELWKDPNAAEGADPWLWTCTVLTTSAPDDLGQIHDRMPLLVEKDRYAEWLDPTRDDTDELTSLLVPAAPGRLSAYPVSTEVNNVRNNSPRLVEPIPAEGGPDGEDQLF
jgi:putative SOS response-associated peptidase YedK